MRRLGIVAVTFLLTMLLETAMCFAGALNIVNSYPHDGGTGFQPVNCAVKLYFNQDVSDKGNIEANLECFKITGPENEVQPIQVLYDSKDTSMVLVVLKDTLESDSEYRLTISGDFMATSGDILEFDKEITFRTRNLSTDSKISMAMMAVMFVGILFFSSRQMKRQVQKAERESGREEKVNPYKVSKKTGKSVSEIVEKTEKERRKKAAAEAKRRREAAAKAEPEEDEAEDNGNKRVKGPRPISAGGSTYKSGKKAKAEAKARRKAAELAAARAAGTTKPKKQQGKSKKKKK
ncbi:MAG: Ig-like domain-containing protein [Clostridiales bacterium]|nr:Ig-like domain-containing protein [Clostridiales bacterium]